MLCFAGVPKRNNLISVEIESYTIILCQSNIPYIFGCAGITGVPFFEISIKDKPNISQQFSGGQPVDTFVKVFSRLKTLSKV